MPFSPVLFRFFFSLHNLFPFSFSAFFSLITSWSFFLFGKFHSPLRLLFSFFTPVCFYVLSSNSSPDIKCFSPLCLSVLQLLNLFLSLHLIYPKFSPFYLFSLPPVLPFFLLSDCFPLKKITILPLLSQANALFPLFTSTRLPSSFLTTHSPALLSVSLMPV